MCPLHQPVRGEGGGGCAHGPTDSAADGSSAETGVVLDAVIPKLDAAVTDLSMNDDSNDGMGDGGMGGGFGAAGARGGHSSSAANAAEAAAAAKLPPLYEFLLVPCKPSRMRGSVLNDQYEGPSLNLPMQFGENVVGRGVESGIKDVFISRKHATVTVGHDLTVSVRAIKDTLDCYVRKASAYGSADAEVFATVDSHASHALQEGDCLALDQEHAIAWILERVERFDADSQQSGGSSGSGGGGGGGGSQGSTGAGAAKGEVAAAAAAAAPLVLEEEEECGVLDGVWVDGAAAAMAGRGGRGKRAAGGGAAYQPSGAAAAAAAAAAATAASGHACFPPQPPPMAAMLASSSSSSSSSSPAEPPACVWQLDGGAVGGGEDAKASSVSASGENPMRRSAKLRRSGQHASSSLALVSSPVPLAAGDDVELFGSGACGLPRSLLASFDSGSAAAGFAAGGADGAGEGAPPGPAELPPHVWVDVFCFLPTAEAIAVARCCKFWRAVAHEHWDAFSVATPFYKAGVIGRLMALQQERVAAAAAASAAAAAAAAGGFGAAAALAQAPGQEGGAQEAGWALQPVMRILRINARPLTTQLKQALQESPEYRGLFATTLVLTLLRPLCMRFPEISRAWAAHEATARRWQEARYSGADRAFIDDEVAFVVNNEPVPTALNTKAAGVAVVTLPPIAERAEFAALEHNHLRGRRLYTLAESVRVQSQVLRTIVQRKVLETTEGFKPMPAACEALMNAAHEEQNVQDAAQEDAAAGILSPAVEAVTVVAQPAAGMGLDGGAVPMQQG